MKKNVIKMAIAAVCVVAAGMGGMKAYNAANHSEADMLLAENVEALSSGDSNPCMASDHCWPSSGSICPLGGGYCPNYYWTR